MSDMPKSDCALGLRPGVEPLVELSSYVIRAFEVEVTQTNATGVHHGAALIGAQTDIGIPRAHASWLS